MNGAKYSVINTMKGPDTATDILTFASAGKSNIKCQINRMWILDPAENSRYTETQDGSVILHDGEISCRLSFRKPVFDISKHVSPLRSGILVSVDSGPHDSVEMEISFTPTLFPLSRTSYFRPFCL